MGNTVLIKFCENKEVGEIPSVHLSDAEERLRRLEIVVEELKTSFAVERKN